MVNPQTTVSQPLTDHRQPTLNRSTLTPTVAVPWHRGTSPAFPTWPEVRITETCTDSRTNSPPSDTPTFRFRQAGHGRAAPGPPPREGGVGYWLGVGRWDAGEFISWFRLGGWYVVVIDDVDVRSGCGFKYLFEYRSRYYIPIGVLV